jgi:hypothetical protein
MSSGGSSDGAGRVNSASGTAATRREWDLDQATAPRPGDDVRRVPGERPRAGVQRPVADAGRLRLVGHDHRPAVHLAGGQLLVGPRRLLQGECGAFRGEQAARTQVEHLDQLQQSMTWPEFRQAGQQATAGDAARQRYAATIVACANQLPRAGA